MTDKTQMHTNIPPAELVQRALAAEEGVLAANGALTTVTGKRTGRSPVDRFIVRDALTENTVDWSAVNQPMNPEVMEALWQRVVTWLEARDHYCNELHGGADPRYYLPLRVRTETAWHSLFAGNIFIRPDSYNSGNHPEWQIVNAPGFECVPERDGTQSDGAVVLDFSNRRILLAGMRYAGEMKKAVFSVLNYLMPQEDVLPMHCAANVSKDGDVFLFFGLSGTGKTTLSADPECSLIGDDEHGWGEDTVFNFEGGCYAKCINLSAENEPLIYSAIRHGSIMENVVLDDSGNPDFGDDAITENTRCCYPRDFIDNAVPENRAGEPVAGIFLTCDLNGVIPPVSVLSPEAAAYHFLSGYTASMAGVEVGQSIGATFSTCFGAPFFPRRAGEYANLLIKRMQSFGTKIYLVSTGWTGGGYGVGQRIAIPTTRQIIHAIQDGSLGRAKTQRIAGLNLDIPLEIEGVDSNLLNPRNTWQDPAAYDQALKDLVAQFQKNFQRFAGDVNQSIVDAGPNY